MMDDGPERSREIVCFLHELSLHQRTMAKKLSLSSLFVLSINRAVVFVVGLERCSDFTGGGFCPTSNTCCRLPSGASGCIPADLGAYNATCCNDGTGCGVGYDCGPQNTCVAKPEYTDPLVQTLPRYPLCRAPPHLQEIYGFIGGNNNNKSSSSSLSDDNLIIRPAYYSSMGSLESLAHNKSNAIRHVIFVIHGSGRNADDYYCTMYSAVMKQQHHHHHHDDDNQVLVIAPRFASMSDEAFALHNNAGMPMRWDEGAWRYGAEAVNNPNVSSFQVLDDMVSFVSQALVKKNLQRITVIGHSAGGQFVQRWALLTQVWTTTRQQHQHQPAMMRAIVVNPSSYCYLTPLRTSTSRQEWVLPDMTACPAYNDWEWGLATTTAPRYVQCALQELSVTALTRRFAQRDVVYLAGDRDVCNVPGMNKQGWCYSHGLETTCMDMWQGRNRLERHMHYFESLERIVNVTTHRRALVPGVGHDHSLIFHSPATARYLFDNNDNTNNHVQNNTKHNDLTATEQG